MASMSTKKASSSSSSSSSSSTPRWKYDVFLNFRGEDTRNSFTDYLYYTLNQKGIYTFRDDEKLERGKSISPELSKAIEESRFAIVIFSRNYGDSTWCLEELAKIVGCRKEKGMTVLPVFYHVDPSNVRKQTGTFAQAFDKHQERFKGQIEKVQKWRDALSEVANIVGWTLPDGPETKFILDIVEGVSNKLSSFPIETKGLVGINSRVEKLKSHLAIGLNDIRIIGIWGTGGMGKTTLARVVYGMVSNQFEAFGFIANIRENSEKDGLLQLQIRLLNELLMERDVNIHDVDKGVLMIKNRLRHKKILLVLDDVNELEQLKKLAWENDWFGLGSRVIITTRDEHLLKTRKVDGIYEVEGLNYDESFHLFNLKAFEKEHPTEDCLELSQAFVHYAKGLPLAIEVLGSSLVTRSIDEWKNELDRLREFPKSKILNVLQISYDGLEETEKEIFLNIACFFNHDYQDSVIEKLDCLELYPIIGLRVLMDKSLIKLDGNRLWMHDLLQAMGQDIVRKQCLQDPGKRSRLWLYKDINSVLTRNTGSEAIQYIVLDLDGSKKVDWNPKAFSKMRNLKLLKFSGVQLMYDLKHLPNSLRFLDWSRCPLKSLPSSFKSNELVGLCMCYTDIERLWKGTKSLEMLKFIHLDGSHKLIETPDLTKVPNLEKLVLAYCINLCGIHPSIGVHKKLILLDLRGCQSLKTLPSKLKMESLEILNLSGCSKVKQIPEFGENMERVLKLYLDGSAITKLPTSIGYLTGLASLNLRDCKSLVGLPSTIFNLKMLKDVDISGCSKLKRLPENLGNAESVLKLYLDGSAITTLPTSIAHLTSLTKLTLRDCKNLACLPNTIFNSMLLKHLDMSGCSKLERLPENLGNAKSLLELYLDGTAITILPTSIKHLTGLTSLNLRDCKNLVSLPSTLFNSMLLNHVDMSGYSKLQELSSTLGNLKSLLKIYFDGTAVTKLPASTENLNSLVSLKLRDCKNLVCLPSTIFNLKLLKVVNISGCSKFERLPKILGNAESVEELDFSGTAIRHIPSSISLLKNLKFLSLVGCKGLSSTKSWYEFIPFYSMSISPDPLSSLLGMCSLTQLNLSYCNLQTIPNDIGSLFSLRRLLLDENKFVCLPESIGQLSNLKWMSMENCTSLRSLSKLPSNIEGIWAKNCISLEMLPDLLNPNDSFKPNLFLPKCFKLADNLCFTYVDFAAIKKHLQGLSPHYPYSVVIPGTRSEILEWFTHQSMGDEANIKEPSNLCNQWMGIALCVVFCSHPHHQSDDQYGQLRCWLTTNGDMKFPQPAIIKIPYVLSDHLWLLYLPPSYYNENGIKLLWECDANGFTQIGIKIDTGGPGLEVKKLGFRMVYKKDIEDLNRITTQCSSNNITPYDGIDVLHHNFNNLAVAAEGNKIKRSRDDYDEAGPSEEGSSNDVPHAKRIKRLPEFMDLSNSDGEESREFYECDE